MKNLKINLKRLISGIVISLVFSCNQNSNYIVSSENLSTINYTFISSNNICLGDEIEVNFNNLQNSNCGISKIQVSSDGGNTWTTICQGTPLDGELNCSYIPNIIGEYIFRSSWVRTGNPRECIGNNINFNDALSETLVVTDCNCENEFNSEIISCENNSREVNYYFNYTEDLNYIKIQGGLTNWTGEDAIVTINGNSNLTHTQKTPGNSTNRVITIEGSSIACQQTKINIKWNSTNSNNFITGNWSVKDENGNEILPNISELICN